MYGIPQQNDTTLRIIHRNNRCLAIHKDANDQIWLKASTFYGGEPIDEYLICEDKTQGLFQLVSRTAPKVVISIVARRHTMFPINSLVKL